MRLPAAASFGFKASDASASTKGTTNYNRPIIIKPPAIVRQNYSRKPPLGDAPRTPPISERRDVSVEGNKSLRVVSAQGEKSLRNRDIRNPKDPQGLRRSPIDFKTINSKGVDCNSQTGDDEFYRSLRQNGLRSSEKNKRSPKPESPIDVEYSNLRDMADGERETKTVLTESKIKISTLKETLKEQDIAMQVLMNQNEELESKVATLTRKEMMMVQYSGSHIGDPSLRKENKALQMEVERLKLNQLDQVIGDVDGPKFIEERNKLRRKEKQLEKSLSLAREENDRLLEEVNSKMIDMGDRSCSEGQALLERNRLRRKEAQLERSLAAAQHENRALLEEVQSHNLEFEKKDRNREKQDEEMRTLRSELEINRRIVHTKRSLIRKEMTEESKEKLRNDTTEQLTIELTAKITKDVEALFKAQKENELRELRDEDEKKVRDVESQIPILENEIDRLRRDQSRMQGDHERAIASLETHHQSKIEFIVTNFSNDREKEGSDFINRIDALSMEIERNQECAAREKEECESRVREEVTTEMKKELQFLAERVTELTQEMIVVVEKMKKEKELFGDRIREQLTNERDHLLEEAAEVNESYVESIRQEMAEERDQEVSKIKNELEKIIMERESLIEKIDIEKSHEKQSDALQQQLEDCIRQVEELESEKDVLQPRLQKAETDLQFTKENYANCVEELDASRFELEWSKNEIVKLKNQRDELLIMAEEFKNDCINASNEIQKIKEHFKFAVLVEYEEKIIELESELQRLETVVEESKAFNSEDVKKISEQSSQLEQYKAKVHAQETEMKKLSKALMTSVSELESKDSRLIELKNVIQKKETEASKVNECVKDLRKSLGACESELARVRKEQESSSQRIISTQAYKEKIASLNKELAKHKSSIEHCRCDCKPSDNSELHDYNHHQERIQRLSVMLRVAEKNHHNEKSIFESTKERLHKDLLESKDEIEGLHSEVWRLENLLNRSRNGLKESLDREGWQYQFAQDGHTPRIKNSQSTIQKLHDGQTPRIKNGQPFFEHLQQKELLHKIETAERVVGDAKQYRFDSEKIIRKLKDELILRVEEKRKVSLELRNSKLLFREAVMSWRVETRSLKKELHQLRQSDRSESAYTRKILQNQSDSDSEPSKDSSKLQEHLFQIIREFGDSEQRENIFKREKNSLPPSLEISSIDSGSWSGDNMSKPQHQPESPTLHSIDEHSEIRDDTEDRILHSTVNTIEVDKTEVRDNVSHPQGIQGGKESFTKMLNISEHSTSIEMRFDPPNGEKSIEEQQPEVQLSANDSATAIFNSLQEFKNEYKQSIGSDHFTDIIGNSYVRKNHPDVQGRNSRNNKITKLSRAPQPRLHDSKDAEDGSVLDRYTISKVDTRDDNSMENIQGSQRSNREFPPRQVKDSSLPQNHVLVTTESDDCSSKDVSIRSNVSERSRILRKKMSDLLDIKNNIKQRSSSHVTADTNRNNGRVAKQQQQEQRKQEGTTATTTAAAAATKPTTAATKPTWGLAPGEHPKLYKFLNSKSLSEQSRGGSGAGLSAVPTDEHLDRRDALPFDENSKHSWRNYNAPSATAATTTTPAMDNRVAAHE